MTTLSPRVATPVKVEVKPAAASDPVMWVLGAYVVVTAVAPYKYGAYLAPAVAIAAAWSFLTRRTDPSVLLWTLGLSGYGFAVTIHGLLMGNEGASATITIHAIEPLVLGLAFGAMCSRGGWHIGIRTILDMATLAVAAVGILVYLANIRAMALPVWLVDPKWSYADLTEGTLRTNFQGYNSFIFLAPYALMRFFDELSGSRRTWRLLLLCAGLSGLLLSGRRILYIGVPLALLAVGLTVALRSRAARRTRSPHRRPVGAPRAVGVGLALCAVGGLLHAVGLGPLSALDRVASQFTLGDASDKRADQGQILLDAWSASPWIGHGAGATTPNYFRNSDAPWAFELSYHMILFNFGLLGFILLASWGLWILAGLVRGVRRSEALALPLLAGYISVVVSIYVDPYVQKFDGMWMLFIPFVASAAYRSRDRQAHYPESRHD